MRFDGSDGHSEDLRGLLLAEIEPVAEDERLPLPPGQFPDRREELLDVLAEDGLLLDDPTASGSVSACRRRAIRSGGAGCGSG